MHYSSSTEPTKEPSTNQDVFPIDRNTPKNTEDSLNSNCVTDTNNRIHGITANTEKCTNQFETSCENKPLEPIQLDVWGKGAVKTLMVFHFNN